QVVAEATFEPGAVSVTSQLQAVTSAQPQALVVWSTGAAAAVALKAISQLRVDLPVATTNGNLTYAFLRRIADYTPKTLLIAATQDFWWQDSDRPAPAPRLEAAYHHDYQPRFGGPPDFGPGVAYDAVLVMAQAIEKAGSTNAGGIKAALEKVDGFEGVVGTYHMSADDHRGLTVEDVRMVQAKNGKFTYVGK
ncbi:MAG: ABC transporter substrate-binding protein, partial [Sciscionella sp.]